MEEARKKRATRHRDAAPVELEDGRGITRDFSSTGIFFETEKSFAPGQPIDFTIILENVDPERPVRVKCRGNIARIEETGPKIGVAVEISSYRFERPRDPAMTQRRVRTPRV